MGEKKRFCPLNESGQTTSQPNVKPMTTLPAQNSPSSFYSLKALCRLIGIACLAGFVVDLFVLTFPPSFGALQWRVGFMQQVGDRSIILLFGLALTMYGLLDQRNLRRQLALVCLVLGVIFNLSCVLVIRDSLTFQEQAMISINQQASTLQSQIQNLQNNPPANQRVTPEQLQQATKALGTQADTLRQNAKTGTLRNAVSSVGNLVIVGLTLIALGQFGLRPPKN